MKPTRVLALLAVFFIAAGSSAAIAATRAYPTHDLNLRAGPSTRFPPVTVLRKCAAVTIHGCIRKYTWCDVSWGRYRGWASAAYLTTVRRNRTVYVPQYARVLDLPIIVFEIAAYWDRYYYDYDFYRDLDDWDDYAWIDDGPPPGWVEEWDDLDGGAILDGDTIIDGGVILDEGAIIDDGAILEGGAITDGEAIFDDEGVVDGEAIIVE